MNYEGLCRTAPTTLGLLNNDKGVCKTAPATPSLLNIKFLLPNCFGLCFFRFIDPKILHVPMSDLPYALHDYHAVLTVERRGPDTVV